MRFMIISVVAICLALLAMRLGRSREPDLSSRAAVPGELSYVGTTDDLAYHSPSCRQVVKAHTDKLVTFISAKQAAQRGYRQCPICMP
jgi:hypothetical protein